MTATLAREAMLKRTVKAAVKEAMDEHKDIMADLLEEALLDFGLVQAVWEGERSRSVSRNRIFEIIKG